MNDNLDTNQASEGELRAIIERYIDRAAVLAKQDGTSFNNKHLLKLDMATAIETIIRTEKLKLLSEVRERVVGEDETRIPADGGPFTNTTDKPNHYITLRNANRADQRAALTKLEAEL